MKEKKSQISALFLTQRPPDDWPDALDHLAISFVAQKYTKPGKTSEILLLSLWLSYMKIPLCYSTLPQENIYVCTTHLLHIMTMTLHRPPNNYVDKKLHGHGLSKNIRLTPIKYP